MYDEDNNECYRYGHYEANKSSFFVFNKWSKFHIILLDYVPVPLEISTSIT